MNARDYILRILPKTLYYRLVRHNMVKHCRPITLTFSVTGMCQSGCKTCYIGQEFKKRPNEIRRAQLRLEEIEKFFASLGEIYFLNISGGEPFLRNDLPEIIKLAMRYLRPHIIHIPTNAFLPEKIETMTRNILKIMNTRNHTIPLTVKPSIDGVAEKHDEIRGFPENFERAMKTYEDLKELRNYPNFTVGIHTVISNFNVDDFKKIYQELIQLEPDSYITEIAEERVELGTIGEGITPTHEKYSQAIDYLRNEMITNKASGVAKVAQAFRYEYYALVKSILLERTQVIPCFAGILSAQISPDGDVWPCCIRGDSMGNLREYGYNFRSVWINGHAANIRKSIKNKECYCPLANASYTNMLVSYRTMAAILKNMGLRKMRGYLKKG